MHCQWKIRLEQKQEKPAETFLEVFSISFSLHGKISFSGIATSDLIFATSKIVFMPVFFRLYTLNDGG